MNDKAKQAILKEIASGKAKAKALRALSAALREFPSERKQTLREEKKINQFLIDRGIENAAVSFCGSEWVPEIKVRFGPSYPYHDVTITVPKRPEGEEHLHRGIYPFHPNTADHAEAEALKLEDGASNRETALQSLDEKIAEFSLLYKAASDAAAAFRAAAKAFPWEVKETLFEDSEFPRARDLDKVY